MLLPGHLSMESLYSQEPPLALFLDKLLSPALVLSEHADLESQDLLFHTISILHSCAGLEEMPKSRYSKAVSFLHVLMSGTTGLSWTRSLFFPL